MRHALLFFGPIALFVGPTAAFAQHGHHHGHTPAVESATPPPKAAPSADPHAGHKMPATPAKPVEQHSHSAGHHASSMGHAGHAPDLPDPPITATPPAALLGPRYAADGIHDTTSMSAARKLLRMEHGGMMSGKVFIDQLEAVVGKGKDGYAWQAEAWYGGDIDRIWLKTEGEGHFSQDTEAEVQALWSHAVDPWFNLQAGVRQDIGHGPDRTYAVLGVKGLAPYWIEMDGALFLSNKGDVTARFELEHDMRITRKLILQPSAHVLLSAQDVPEKTIGAGLASAKLGLRLRYEYVPEFAPYVGVTYESAFGKTATLRRRYDEQTHGFAFVAGVRSWF